MINPGGSNRLTLQVTTPKPLAPRPKNRGAVSTALALALASGEAVMSSFGLS